LMAHTRICRVENEHRDQCRWHFRSDKWIQESDSSYRSEIDHSAILLSVIRTKSDGTLVRISEMTHFLPA
jgi:hypothetical protein